MKHVLFIIAFLGIIPSLFSQEKNNTSLDSLFIQLEKYAKQDSFQAYYFTLRAIDNYYLKEKDYNNLFSTNSYYDILPNNKIDSAIYRKFLIYHAQNLKIYANNYYEAIPFYLKSHSFASDKINLDGLVFYSEHILANIYARLNDYDKALYFNNLCIKPLLSTNDFSKLSRLYSDIGDCYLWLGQINNMKESYNIGIKYALTSKNKKGLLANYSNYADYYLSINDYDNFYFYSDKSEDCIKSIGLKIDQGKRWSELQMLKGDSYYLQNDYENSIKFYSMALDTLKKYSKPDQSRVFAKIYAKIAKSHLSLKNNRKANVNILNGFKALINNYDELEIPNSIQISNENTFTDLLRVKASYYYEVFKKNEKVIFLDSAIIAINLSINANNQLDNMLLLNNSKYESLEQNKQLVNQAMLFSYIALDKTNNQSYLTKIKEYIKLSKSQLLLENQYRNTIRTQLSDAEKNSINKLEHLLIENFNSNKNHQLKQKTIVDLNIQIEDIQKKHTINKPQYRPIKSPYIEYVEGINHYYLYTNIGEEQFIQLDTKKNINNLIQSVNQLIIDKDQHQLSSKLELLYQQLIPIKLSLQDILTIIPDGQVSYVPFDLLRHNDKYLMEEKIISLRYHNQNVDLPMNNHEDIRMFTLQPNYRKESNQENINLERGKLNYLPFAKKEVDHITSTFLATHTIANTITYSSLKNQLKKSDIFHFTGHAIARNDSAFMLIIDDNNELIKLSTEQIFYMTNQLDLVILSACETGLGTYQQGEGVRSLANAFLNSGAQSIVYSLWNANDISTSKIMTTFYNHMNNGIPKAKALNLAKRAYIKKASPSYQHPYYWAAFCIAENTEYTTVRHSLDIYWIVSFSILSLIIILIFYYFFITKTKQYEN